MKILLKILWVISWPFSWILLFGLWLNALVTANSYKKVPEDIDIELRHKKIHRLCRLFLYIKDVKINLISRDHIEDKPLLYLINHKSNIDSIIIFKILFEKTKKYPIFIAKQELNKGWKGAILNMIDVKFIDRDNLRQNAKIAIEQVEEIKDKKSIVIFPEGTRVTEHEFAEFKAGVLMPAYKTYVNVQPVVIYNTLGMLDSKNKSKKEKDNIVDVNILPSIQAKDYMNIDSTILIKNIQEKMYKVYEELKKNHKPYIEKTDE